MVVLSEDPWKWVDNDWKMKDNERIINHNQRQWMEMIELKRGTFLALEIAREYENSGKWIRVQGKYLPVIRRHILFNDGFLSEDNDYFQGLWKTIKDCG